MFFLRTECCNFVHNSMTYIHQRSDLKNWPRQCQRLQMAHCHFLYLLMGNQTFSTKPFWLLDVSAQSEKKKNMPPTRMYFLKKVPVFFSLQRGISLLVKLLICKHNLVGLKMLVPIPVWLPIMPGNRLKI